MRNEDNIPEHLAEYLSLKKPLDLKAIGALKKWAYSGLPTVKAFLQNRECCCCCCCCDHAEGGPEFEISLSARIDLWIAPGSYPQAEIVDIRAETSWQAPPGSTVILEVQHLRADGTIIRGWDPIFQALPASGVRVWDPPLLTGGGYGHRVCFQARTDSGLFSRVVCRAP